MPEVVEFAVSMDGKEFTDIGTATSDTPQKTPDKIIEDLSVIVEKQRARYVRVKAKNLGTCPPWHPGAGGKAWVFVDEIMVE